MWLGVVRLLQERELMPAIAFGFSRHSLEVLAEHLSSVDLLSKSEKNEVQQFLRFSIKNRLKGPDSRLPSVLFISGLVKRGIAVHHAGMLPLLKEVHYLNDAERGHVWEQIMIMLPKHVVLVMLSATVPNTLEFADWLGRIRGSEIHVVATDKRPVPLEHYLFTGLDGQATSKQLHLVVDRHGQFHVPGYKQAIIAFNEPKTKKPKGEKDTSRAEELAALAQQARGGRPAPEGVGGRGGASGRGGGKGGGKHPIGGKLNTPGRWNYMPCEQSLIFFYLFLQLFMPVVPRCFSLPLCTETTA
ncbi:Helicase SKI2W [Fasciola hepatica]|uniref:Helicase SKI2W n=1 Tax=Fasciola hepatica TaxID=6192 RepID=A0A2H1BT80_FASHE|nr:Helicase SKI2W [Fasciola hepatica]